MTCEQMKCERCPDVQQNLHSDGFITRIGNKCINFEGIFGIFMTESKTRF